MNPILYKFIFRRHSTRHYQYRTSRCKIRTCDLKLNAFFCQVTGPLKTETELKRIKDSVSTAQ